MRKLMLVDHNHTDSVASEKLKAIDHTVEVETTPVDSEQTDWPSWKDSVPLSLTALAPTQLSWTPKPKHAKHHNSATKKRKPKGKKTHRKR